MKLKVKKMFDECKEKYGSALWYGVELALTQDAYPDGTFDNWYFRATAMDKNGNLWDVCWNPNDYNDYSDQVEDWDSPSYAEMVDRGYYLD